MTASRQFASTESLCCPPLRRSVRPSFTKRSRPIDRARSASASLFTSAARERDRSPSLQSGCSWNCNSLTTRSSTASPRNSSRLVTATTIEFVRIRRMRQREFRECRIFELVTDGFRETLDRIAFGMLDSSDPPRDPTTPEHDVSVVEDRSLARRDRTCGLVEHDSDRTVLAGMSSSAATPGSP